MTNKKRTNNIPMTDHAANKGLLALKKEFNPDSQKK